MVLYPYRGTLTLDEATGARASNVVGQIYALTDTGFTSPLTPRDASGAAVSLISSALSTLPTFYIEDHPSVNWKSGAQVFPLVTSVPIPGEKGAPGEDGAPGLPGVNAVPAADAVAGYIATPGSAAHAALRDSYGTVQGYQSQRDRARYIPAFRKLSSQPVFKKSQQAALSSIYWLWGQRVDGLLADPMDKYYFWYSTNHDAGAGGIALATAPTPAGPFTDRGKVFTDTTTGSQTETPSILWNEAEGLFFMYYQQKLVGAPQATLLATSPDGVAWTRVGVVLGGVNTSSVLGSADETYFQPFRIGERWAGYHLMGGGNYGRFGISYSNDGRIWQRDPRGLGSGLEWTQATGGRVLGWNGSTVFSYKGRMWWVGLLANRASGSDAKNNRIAVAPISADLRRLTAPPHQILPMTEYAWESSDIQSLTFMSDGPNLYLYYQCGSETIGCAVLEG